MPNVSAINLSEIVENPITWAPDGCPTWCEYTELHRSSDHYVDRSHHSAATHLPLDTEPRVSVDQPASVDAHLSQHYRETEPRVWVGLDETATGKHMTLDEAREFALRLLELVRHAETPAWQKSSWSGSFPGGNCVEVAKVAAPVPGDCFGHCCACGGDGRMGSAPCGVCGGTGRCGH